MKQPRLKIDESGEKLLWCRGCEEYLPIADFAINLSQFGYSTKCFNCNNIRKIREYQNSNAKKLANEKTMAYELLGKLGYDTESDETIHQQFLKRHNL